MFGLRAGLILTKTLITPADGASVTLKDVTISGWNMEKYNWAGISCLGDVTISLSGTNSVKGFDADYPGIYIVPDKTLTINGDGTLNVSTNGHSAAIGGGQKMNVGNIVIESGTIIAEGGEHSAGIGVGCDSSCGDITITNGVTKVTAINGGVDSNSIGAGEFADCGTVTICGKTGAISESPYELEPKAVDGVNEVISSPQSAGNIYYDLNGRRVEKLQKGVYIVKGKKFGVE